MQGKVKFFNEQKGFGFITETTENKDYFVHVSGLLNRIVKDNVVEFELEDSPRGKKAVNVKLIKM